MKYVDPGKKINWNVNYKNYSLPALQDEIFQNLKNTDLEFKAKLFEKYKISNLSQILILSINETIEIAKELNI